MERVDHEDAADLIGVASTENPGVEGTDTSTGEHPTITDGLSALPLPEDQGLDGHLRPFFSRSG